MSELEWPSLGSLPALLVLRVEQQCSRFEAAWKAGRQPRVEDYLEDTPEPGYAVLLVELIKVEVHHRRAAGESPAAEDYRARFPALNSAWIARIVTATPSREDGVATGALEGGDAAAGQAQRIRCPTCHNPIQLTAGQGDTVLCPGCGSSFELRDARQTTTTQAMRRLGKFQLLERVGLGAFGAVWKARDTELDRIVALKIPHSGLLTAAEELERFHREARAAAQLRHPGIVTVHEVVTLEGLPTIVADFIGGVTLRDLLEIRPLTFRESAGLIADVAEAVHYAHSMRLVHRDLKPANIMVEYHRPPFDEDKGIVGEPAPVGRPLVMDFGLALRGEAEVTMTQDGQRLGTPAYMSPEQAAGYSHRADARSDVYSLGVILYQLVCGELPFRGSKAMMVHQVVHEEPRPPRRVNDKIPRDLETICLKCLRKEPGQRYASAGELADDLRRFLNGEPIRARPSTAWEKILKWSRRKPAAAALIGVSGLAVLTLFGVIIGFTVQLQEALKATRDERDQAARERAVAQAVNGFLQHDLLGQADISNQPLLAGQAERNPDIKVRELLDRAATAIEGKFPDQPEVEAAIRQTIGDTYRALSAYDKAREQIERAVAWRQQYLGADHPDTLTSKHNLALLYEAQGKYAQAEPLLKEVLQAHTAKLGVDHPNTLACKHNLAVLYWAQGKYEQAEPLLKEGLQADTAKLGADHPDTLTSKHNLAVLYWAQGKYAQAEPLSQEVLQTRTAKLGADHPNTLTSKANLALLYQAQGKYAQAEPLSQEVLQTRTAKLGAGHPDTLTSKHNLAVLYQAQGKYEQAEPLSQEVLQARTAKLGADHPNTLTSKGNLAVLYQAQGKYEQAEPLLKEVLQTHTAKLGADHPDTLTNKGNLALLYQAQGKYAQAEPLSQEVLQTRTAKLGADHPDTLRSKHNLALLYQAQGKYEQVEPLLKEVLQVCTAKLGADHPNTLISKHNLAGLYQAQEKYAQAEPLLLELLAARQQKLGIDHRGIAATLADLGFNYLMQKRDAEAESHLRAGLAIYAQKRPNDWRHFLTQSLLGGSLLGQQQYAAAEPLLLQGYQGLKAREKQIPASRKLRLTEAVERLVQLYDTWGKPEQAKEWRQKLEQAKTATKDPTK